LTREQEVKRIVKVKKPTGPIANREFPSGPEWKTYWGKFVTFKKDGNIYFVFFRYSFFKGVHDITVATSCGDDRDITILDFYPGVIQRFVNQMDTLYFTLFPQLYRKRHPELFSMKQ
jgi:hypothetical protein